ncbi:hypothetical protein HWV62_31577 [Athelia sp. TMB]|nr:hypothetical protein HWV62_31577 [Athelia sp. TMB]
MIVTVDPYQPSNLNGQIRLKAEAPEDGTIQAVAIKILRPRIYKPDGNGKIRKDKGPRREIRLWKFLDHPNIVQLLGLTTDFDQFDPFYPTKPVFPGMVSPWMENGNLNTYLKKNDPQTVDLLKLLCGVAAGLEYLHSKDVIHGDLTPANILIDDNGLACLTDFGLSSLKAGFQKNTSYWTATIGGAIRWRAPELLPPIDWVATEAFNPILTTACDVFSYGQIVLQTFSGQIPYHEIKTAESLTMQLFLRKEPRRPSASISPNLTEEYWMLAKECWGKDLDPETRPSAEELHSRLSNLYANALHFL